jgi:dCMP deaminase
MAVLPEDGLSARSTTEPADSRPSWDQYFMDIADLVSRRATCLRRAVGAVIVLEKRILATGYNGAPSGLKHCRETGCLRENLDIPSGERHEICRGLHGEQNAIIQAAVHGVKIEGGTLYSTHQPCSVCARMIINARVARLVFRGDYPDDLAMELLTESGIEMCRFTEDER